MKDLHQGGLIAARIVGITMLLCLLISFVGLPHIAFTINGTRIVLGDKPPGHHCFFCGMTRSFYAASSGDWPAAYQFNHYGPEFYALFWLGGLCSMLSFANLLRLPMRTMHRANRLGTPRPY